MIIYLEDIECFKKEILSINFKKLEIFGVKAGEREINDHRINDERCNQFCSIHERDFRHSVQLVDEIVMYDVGKIEHLISKIKSNHLSY